MTASTFVADLKVVSEKQRFGVQDASFQMRFWVPIITSTEEFWLSPNDSNCFECISSCVNLKEHPEGRNKQAGINFKTLICLCPFFSFCNILKDARQKFRSVLVEATVKLDELVKKIGKAVEDSKPYWEARRVARQVRTFCLISLCR